MVRIFGVFCAEPLLFALLYLRFALWCLDLNLLSGPDALKVGGVAEFQIMSSLFNKLKKNDI